MWVTLYLYWNTVNCRCTGHLKLLDVIPGVIFSQNPIDGDQNFVRNNECP